jgi:hypothetical protein
VKYPVIAAIALIAGAAHAQPGVTHAYTGPDGLKVEVHTLTGRVGPFPSMLKLAGESPSQLTYTDEIGLDDETFLGNARAALVPGAKQPVAVFQVMPREGFDYSATMTTLCGSVTGIPFIGIESAAGSIRAKGFDGKSPVRVYVYEETFASGRVLLRLCGTLALAPS